MAVDASDELSNLRSESGLSREKVAAAVGYSAKSIERWEKGDLIDANKLRRLRAFYEEFAAKRPSIDNIQLYMPKTGPLRVSEGPPEPRFPIAALLRRPEVRARLNAIQAELIERGVAPEQEDNVMTVLRDRQMIAKFAGGSEDDEYTLEGVLMAIDNLAEVARRFLSGPTL